MNRRDLIDLLYESIDSLGGSASIIDISKYIWANHEDQLRDSHDMFYTWQYDIRWAALELRKEGRMKPAEQSPRGIWEIVMK